MINVNGPIRSNDNDRFSIRILLVQGAPAQAKANGRLPNAKIPQGVCVVAHHFSQTPTAIPLGVVLLPGLDVALKYQPS